MIETLTGTVFGFDFSMHERVVEQLKESHNTNTINEIEVVLKKFKELERSKNAS